jgi:hypothetical protein
LVHVSRINVCRPSPPVRPKSGLLAAVGFDYVKDQYQRSRPQNNLKFYAVNYFLILISHYFNFCITLCV